MKTRTVPLVEYAATNTAELAIDPDAGTVKNVRVLGLKSANGRTYLREAVEKALPLYEGAKVYNDHPRSAGQARSIDELLGYLTNPRLDPDGGIRADLQVMEHAKNARLVLEIASRRPQLVGLSHNARGVERRGKRGADSVIESIEAVHSVDLVTEPATTRSLKESQAMPTVLETLKRALAKQPARLKALREMEGDMPDALAAPMEEPAAAEEGGDHEAAIYAAAKAVIDDDSLDVAQKLAKIRKLLSLVDGGDGETPAEDASTEDMPAEEGKKDNRGNLLESLRLQLQVKDALIDAGHKPGKVLMKALDACTTLQEAKELIAEAASQQPAARPQVKGRTPSAAPVPSDAVPDDAKARARWLMN